jgi:hypothetical protein
LPQFERGQAWPSDPLEALAVGALVAFLLTELDDNYRGRCRNFQEHYVMYDEIF